MTGPKHLRRRVRRYFVLAFVITWGVGELGLLIWLARPAIPFALNVTFPAEVLVEGILAVTIIAAGGLDSGTRS